MELRTHIYLLMAALPLVFRVDACDTEPPPDCERPATPADGVRKVVISHPYTSSGSAAKTFEVLELSTDGVLSRTGTTFELGRDTSGPIVFTPDGLIGMTVQDDGSLGVFRFEADGSVAVVHSAFEGQFYAGQVLMEPDGQRAWILDPNWRENGGGIYSVHIYCDGQLLDEGLQAPAKLAYAMDWVPGVPGEAFLAARDVLSSAAGADAHVLTLGTSIGYEGGTDAFGDDDAIVSSLELTYDARYGLIGDNSLFSGTGNRVAVVDLLTLSPVQVLKNLEDPVALVASPFNNAALVVSGFGDALFRLAYAPASSVPFTLKGELTYSGARPQLPSHAVMIERGSLTGLTLVAENTAIRRVRFESSGAITDLGAFSFGSGYTSIVGSLGVTP